MGLLLESWRRRLLLKNFFTVNPRVYNALRIVGLRSPDGLSIIMTASRELIHKLSLRTSRSGSTSDTQERCRAWSLQTHHREAVLPLERWHVFMHVSSSPRKGNKKSLHFVRLLQFWILFPCSEKKYVTTCFFFPRITFSPHGVDFLTGFVVYFSTSTY